MSDELPPSICEAGQGRAEPSFTSWRKRRRRLQAPASNGGALIDPQWSELPATIDANRSRRREWNFSIAGLSFAALTAQARAELVRAAHDYTRQYRDVSASAIKVDAPLLLAGHQPEMFHPGVWAKNFALARLAGATGATAVNLVIDGDTLNAASLRVPGGSVENPHVEAVPFDAPTEVVPYEERPVVDWNLFRGFGERTARVIEPLVKAPLLATVWPEVVASTERTGRIGLGIAQARHKLEGDWGIQTWELPQSRLCQTRAFHLFVADLLARLPRFAEIHNAALAAFRRAARIRSANHPVPALSIDGDWIEAPFWLWTAGDPRRRRLFVRRVGSELELADRAAVVRRVPSSAGENFDALAEALAELPRHGIRLRTRALMTTMYARLLLGDLFIHGIGGGKYDGLTDALIERFYKVAAPHFAVVSATLRLPVGRPARDGLSQKEIRQRLWQVRHHPEAFIDMGELEPADTAQAAALIAEKRRRIAESPTPDAARDRCQAIRRANQDLQKFAAAARKTLEKNLADTARREQAERELGSREYAAILFPEQDLRALMLAFPNG